MNLQVEAPCYPNNISTEISAYFGLGSDPAIRCECLDSLSGARGLRCMTTVGPNEIELCAVHFNGFSKDRIDRVLPNRSAACVPTK